MYRRVYVGSIALLAALFVGAPLSLRVVQAVQEPGPPPPVGATGSWSGFYEGAAGFGQISGQFTQGSPKLLFGSLAFDQSPLFNAHNFQFGASSFSTPLYQLYGVDREDPARLQAVSQVQLLNDGAGLLDGTFVMIPPNFGKSVAGVHTLLRDFALPPGVAAPAVAGEWGGAYFDDNGAGGLQLLLEQTAQAGQPLPSAFTGTLHAVNDSNTFNALFMLRGSISATGQMLAIGQGSVGRLKLDGQAQVNDQGVATSANGVHVIELLDGTTVGGTFTINHILIE